MFVFYEWCLLSGRGLCCWPIPRLAKSYLLCVCVCVCVTDCDQVQQQLTAPTVSRCKRSDWEVVSTVNSRCYSKQGWIIGVCNEVKWVFFCGWKTEILIPFKRICVCTIPLLFHIHPNFNKRLSEGQAGEAKEHYNNRTLSWMSECCGMKGNLPIS
jgi:hypothetical protein